MIDQSGKNSLSWNQAHPPMASNVPQKTYLPPASIGTAGSFMQANGNMAFPNAFPDQKSSGITGVSGANFNTNTGGDSFGFGTNGLSDKTTEMPGAKGSWMKGAEIGIGAANVGLGVYNALQQSKMNKFMRKYYGQQMDMQKTDFSNAAHSTNEALESRQRRRIDARGGGTYDSTENKAQTGEYMKQWGVDEKF